MRSTKAGIPRSVSATRSSSRKAGTTTATRLPSSIVRLRALPRVPSLDDRVGDRRGERAEEEPDDRADRGRVATAGRRRPARDRGLHDPALLDVLREREQLLILEELLLHGAAALLGEADRVVRRADHDQLVG